MAIFSKNGRVRSCYHGHKNLYLLCMRRHPHALLFINKIIKWVDQGVVYPFDYPVYSVIRPASGTRCPDNRGSTVQGFAESLNGHRHQMHCTV